MSNYYDRGVVSNTTKEAKVVATISDGRHTRECTLIRGYHKQPHRSQCSTTVSQETLSWTGA